MSAIRGIIRKGQVIMAEPADLPDETEVEIVPVGLSGSADDEGTLSPDEIARALWISRYTVKDHVKAVYAKLGVASRAELGAKVFHEHVVPGLGSQQLRQFDRAESAS